MSSPVAPKTAESHGPDTATNVVVKDTLPAGVEFVSASVNGTDPCTQVAGVVTCNLGQVSGSADVQVVVRPTATGTIENVATVSSDVQDPDAINNESRISTQVKPPQAPLIAEAITRDQAFITGASFVERPPNGQPNIVSDTPLAGLPTHGSSYGILTTGDATIAGNPNDSGSSGASNGGGNVRGDNDFDVSILKVDLAVPQAASCLSIDFKYLSEEYPEFVNGGANDAFIAELDNSTWTTSRANGTLSAPNNFAFDQLGNPISIDSTGSTSVSAEAAAGTTYDAATRLLTAKTPITPGAHSVYLSIFDQGDSIYDSAAFVDNLNLTADSGTNCQSGVQLKTDLSISATDSPDPASVGGDLTYTLKATNNGPDPATGVVVEDTLPAGVEFVSASASQGTCAGTATVTCEVGDLASGASATVTVVVRPTASAAPNISNTATVKGAEQDPDNANNSVTESTAVGTTPPPADTTPPDTTIDSGPSGTVTSATANFTFSSSEVGSTFECSLDGAAFTACSSPKEYTGLSGGEHTLRVKATDTAGNTDATPASRTWTIDATAPTVSSVTPTGGATDVAASTNVTATFSEAMGPATITNSTFTLTKQGATSPVTATVSYDTATKKATLNPGADLEPGVTYTATVKGGASGAKDLAGNTLANDKTWSFTIVVPEDTVAPEGTVKINGGKAYATRTAVTLTLSANDPAPGTGVTSMRLMNDGGAWSDWESYATTKSWTFNDAQGTRTVSVQYRDEAGNVSTTVLDKIILDTVHPRVIKKSPAGAPGGISAKVGAKNVSPTANVTATFSEKMNPRTITNKSIILRRDLGKNRYQSVRAKVTYNASTKTATLNPSGKLASGAVYVATVFQSNKDLAGNRLDQYTGLRGDNGLFWRFQIRR